MKRSGSGNSKRKEFAPLLRKNLVCMNTNNNFSSFLSVKMMENVPVVSVSGVLVLS